MHPHRVGDYRGRGCLYRHAADKLVGVSAGGITLSGKKHPVSSLSSPPSLSLYLPSLQRAENRGAEAQGPMYHKHEGRDDEADKSEFAAEQVGTDFSTWVART